jgi:hypothetical protein
MLDTDSRVRRYREATQNKYSARGRIVDPFDINEFGKHFQEIAPPLDFERMIFSTPHR